MCRLWATASKVYKVWRLNLWEAFVFFITYDDLVFRNRLMQRTLGMISNLFNSVYWNSCITPMYIMCLVFPSILIEGQKHTTTPGSTKQFTECCAHFDWSRCKHRWQSGELETCMWCMSVSDQSCMHTSSETNGAIDRHNDSPELFFVIRSYTFSCGKVNKTAAITTKSFGKKSHINPSL